MIDWLILIRHRNIYNELKWDHQYSLKHCLPDLNPDTSLLVLDSRGEMSGTYKNICLEIRMYSVMLYIHTKTNILMFEKVFTNIRILHYYLGNK